MATLALLAVPAAALAFGAAPGDGTLGVSAASGTVSVAARGALIGQIDRGKVTIDDPDPRDGRQPVVSGYESRREVTDTKIIYSGTDLRFRIIGGFFRAKVSGTGMDLSIVGRGSVTIGPSLGLITAGTFSLNGAAAQPFPDLLTSLQLAAPAPGG